MDIPECGFPQGKTRLRSGRGVAVGGEMAWGNSCELVSRFSAKRDGWRASGHVVCALLPAEEASGKRKKMPMLVMALIRENSKGGLVHVHPNQLLGEWKERSIDTKKMAMQVEPRWAIWVEYQRNQSQMELLRFGIFFVFLKFAFDRTQARFA